ncbi:MAG: hypothetical protein IPJ56_00415 [Gemmatimonadetes bacterium]|nr:hypothetical protein [Gemmatimonadota bacterium]
MRRFSSQGDPLGKSITVFRMAQGRADMGTRIIAPIVGVIADERLFGAAQPAPPIVYVPYTWNVWPNIFVAVRSSMPTATLAPLLKAAVFSVEPAVPVAGTSPWTTFRPLGFYIDGLLQARRVNAWSLSAFSMATLLLATIGIFGVMAFIVVQRSREIGLRLALGASPASVSRWVLWQTVRLALLGVALGTGAALLWSRVMQERWLAWPRPSRSCTWAPPPSLRRRRSWRGSSPRGVPRASTQCTCSAPTERRASPSGA